MIGRKSAGLRLAPPTSAPSTSATRENLGGVVGLDRAAVEDAHALARLAISRDQPRAERGMHFADVGDAGDLAGADRPDRLIGDD